MPPTNIKDLLNENRDFLASWSDIVGIIHTMEKKVSKLHDVVIGDREFGQEGILQELKKIKEDISAIESDISEIKKTDPATIKKEVEDLKSYKNKLVGISLGMGVFIAIIWELLKTLFKK
jgi:hypothetical protein